MLKKEKPRNDETQTVLVVNIRFLDCIAISGNAVQYFPVDKYSVPRDASSES